MLDIPQHRDRLGVVGGLLQCHVKEALRIVQQVLTKEHAGNLQHQFDVVVVAEVEDPVERPNGRRLLAELEQRLAEAGERVFVVGVEDQRFFETLARPSKLVARQARIPDTNVELDGVGIERQPLAQHAEGVIVVPFVVELVSPLVVLLGAQKRRRHRPIDLRLG